MSIKDKIIAFDLDGTFVRGNGIASEYTVKMTAKLIEMGYHITLCTGRNIISGIGTYRDCKMKEMGVFCNGLITYNPTTNFTLECIQLTKEVFDSYLDNKELISYLSDILVEIDEDAYALTGNRFKNVKQIGDFRDFIPKLPSSMVFCLKDVNDEQKVKDLVNKINPTYSFRNWGDIGEFYNNHFNKEYGLNKMLDYYNKKASDLIYFGDGINDIEALEYAGIGVAMSNSTDFVKSHANQVTEYSNDEDGAIKHLVKMIEEDENITIVL